MVVLDFFIVNVALPSMRARLHASDGAIEWIVAGYSLTATGDASSPSARSRWPPVTGSWPPASVSHATENRVGGLLRDWRQRRRLSQMDLAHDDGPELAFFSTITTFGTAVDVTVSELAVEAFFPADTQTAEYLRAAGG